MIRCLTFSFHFSFSFIILRSISLIFGNIISFALGCTFFYEYSEAVLEKMNYRYFSPFCCLPDKCIPVQATKEHSIEYELG